MSAWQALRVQLSHDVAALLDALAGGLQEILQEQLVGIYLRGSLVLGDFDPQTSDLDLLAVTERPLGDADYKALLAFHTRLAGLPNPYAREVEIAYIDRAALRRFRPGLRHLTLGRGETLAWTEHGANWILERWAVYERGIALLGPDPKSLIDPIPPAEIKHAVRARLPDWAEWARQPDDPDWRLPLSHKAYVVETMCRALHTLATGELASKQQAVVWARQNLPEPWHTLVVRSQAWRTDQTVDLSVVEEVRDFVLWVASYAAGAP
jgi:hypothetical protein